MAGEQMGGVFDPTRGVALTNGFSFTPTMPLISQDVTATGATGTTATDLGVYYPCLVTATGVSGAGVNLASGAAVPGAFLVIKNMMTGVLKIYAVGGTINGSTGTTAVSLTATGNKLVVGFCTVAGAWQVGLNT